MAEQISNPGLTNFQACVLTTVLMALSSQVRAEQRPGVKLWLYALNHFAHLSLGFPFNLMSVGISVPEALPIVWLQSVKTPWIPSVPLEFREQRPQ